MARFDPTALPDAALEALPALCRRYGVERLEVFGSAVTGHFDPYRSDIDFLVTFEETAGSNLADHLGLTEALRSLLQRDVDLVSESALQNPFVRERIMRERVPVFVAP